MSIAKTAIASDCRVLIVEDERRMRELLQSDIPELGFPATAARSAEEAMRIMQSEPHEIVLLDLQLPLMGGMELFDEIRKRWPATQVIILTGYGSLEYAQQAIRLEAADFLSKPCAFGDLERALDRARKRIGAVVPAATPDIPEKPDPDSDPPPQTLDEIEKVQIMHALKRNQGNRTAAARQLGISRRKLHYRLKFYASGDATSPGHS